MDNCLESISLPSSIDAEKAILGSIMLDNGAFLESSMRIFDSDFYYDSHRTIYAQMMQMFEQGLTVDIITLQESLSRAKQLEAIGGVTYLATLTEGLPRSYR
jgi:replicative DNA helicase